MAVLIRFGVTMLEFLNQLNIQCSSRKYIPPSLKLQMKQRISGHFWYPTSER